nr:putative reverse transcriptase domain-containing protein [Tanacetum cinerariifolium]
MTYSDEMMDSDNTTLIFSRYPDALPYVYTRSHTTRRSSTLPSSLPPYPTIHTARMSVIPVIKPNLVKHSRISILTLLTTKITLIYHHHLHIKLPLTLEVKPRVEVDHRKDSIDDLITLLRQECEDTEDRVRNAQGEAHEKRLEAFETVVQQIHHPPVNRSTNWNAPNINSGSDIQMLNQLIATRVTEALAAAAVTHAASAVGLTRWFEKLESQFGISNVTDGDRVKFDSSTLIDGSLTWWNVYVRSVTLEAAHTTPWNDFKAMFIRLPLNIKGNVTSSKPVDLHEAIDMVQGLMYQVVQEIRENSRDKRKQGSYAGKLPYCGRCGRHHTDACLLIFHNCGKAGHKDKECQTPPRLADQ